jgi:cytidylate kinase
MIVAIDGPSASGKGTLSKRLADYLGFAHLDTGKIYRAVGMMAVRVGGDPADESLTGSVLDGRDIGTVVCPTAEVKLYVTANTEIRAERRHKELLERGESSIYARVLQDMKERDERDTNRSVAPLKPAEDAFILDTSDLDAEQAFAAALAEIERTGR